MSWRAATRSAATSSRCDEGLASEAVAERFFSALEHKRLRALPKEAWLEGFFDCWTRKEALLKASGYGFSPPLGAVEAPPYAAVWRPERWRLWSFAPASGFRAAIAIAAEPQATALR